MHRSLALAFALVALTPRAAHAEEACTAPIGIAGGRFVAKPVSGGLHWNAQWVVDVDGAAELCGGTITLAVPLPPDERLLPTPHVEAVIEDGRIAALRVDREALTDRSITATFFQRIGQGPAALGAPVAAGDSVQMIDTASPDSSIELVRSAAVDDRFEKHLGWVAPRAVGRAAREEARRLVAIERRTSASPIYVRGQDVRAVGGLQGRLVDAPARSKSTSVAVFGVFALVLGALVLAFRQLGRAAQIERADAVLAAEIDAAAKERA